MVSASEKTDQLAKQCDQLAQIATNLDKTVSDAITKASSEMQVILNEIKEGIDETMSTVANDTNEWKQLKENLATTSVQGMVLLNVGGRKFTTSVDTLTMEKDTFFTALLSNQWKVEKDKDGYIFIDEDGDIFAEILIYMRNPAKYVLSDEKLRQRMINDAEKYKLLKLLSLLCCFLGTTLLNFGQQQKLNEFYDKKDQLWSLIYKGTRDGFDAAAFHNRANNQGPTMTIIRSTDGYIFGGYASQAWTSADNYTDAANSFLFLLTNANGSPPTKFLYNSNGNGMYNHADYGPTFGGGHDLSIPNSCNTNNCTCTLGNSYPDSLNLGANTFTGSNTFLIADIEVFKLA